jgi:hypothetical protein
MNRLSKKFFLLAIYTLFIAPAAANANFIVGVATGGGSLQQTKLAGGATLFVDPWVEVNGYKYLIMTTSHAREVCKILGKTRQAAAIFASDNNPNKMSGIEEPAIGVNVVKCDYDIFDGRSSRLSDDSDPNCERGRMARVDAGGVVRIFDAKTQGQSPGLITIAILDYYKAIGCY